MKITKAILGALLSAALLTGCGGSSDKISNVGLSDMLDDFKLSNLISGYKDELKYTHDDNTTGKIYQHNSSRYNGRHDPLAEKYGNTKDRYPASGDPYRRGANGYPGGAPQYPYMNNQHN